MDTQMKEEIETNKSITTSEDIGRKPLPGHLFGNCRSVSEFEKLHTLGEGTYGTVYCARDKVSKEIVALKKVKIQDENEGFPITSLREIKILEKLKRHLNVVKLKEVVVGFKKDSIFLVFEHSTIDVGCLIDHMRENRDEMSLGEIKCLILQLLNGVSYMHKKFIMHRDLKLSNLLIGGDGILKIADFGLARGFEKPPTSYTPRVVTLWYRAPEILLENDDYDESADIWSIGCILGEFLQQGIPLFKGKIETDQFCLICELLGYPGENLWEEIHKIKNNKEVLSQGKQYKYNTIHEKFKKFGPNCINLLSTLLRWNPKKRINADEAMCHPFFFEHPRPVDPEDMKFLTKLEFYSNESSKSDSVKKKVKK